MKKIIGKGVSCGEVMGKIKIIRHTRYGEDGQTSTSPANEKIRLESAVRELEAESEKMYRNALLRVGESEASIFEIHKMMLSDEDFTGEAKRMIENESLRAECAVRRAGDKLADAFRAMESEYMKARAADVISVTDRLCEVLMGEHGLGELSEPVIIISDDLTPAETVMLERDKVLGFVTERGSELSHTAILSRVMGIPAVVSVGAVPDEWDGMTALIDGRHGTVCVEPDEDSVREYRAAEEESRRERKRLEKMRGVRLKNPSGERVIICSNAGDLSDIDEGVRNDTEGVGLFRSEFIFMSRQKPPNEDEQLEIYTAAAKKLGGEELVVRTLDVGADKRIPYLTGEAREANPALGIRAVRLCLRMPELLRTQLRALYRAAAEHNISVMIPMIVLPSEVERVLEIAHSVRDSLGREGIKYGEMKLGIMIETPSAAILSDILAPMVDFFSVGTNDLIQYTLAADRENPDVAYLTSPLPESVRRCIKMTCTAAEREGIPVCVCGELGADESETKFLLDCGVTKLSVSPGRVLSVREKAAEAVGKEKIPLV